MDCNQEIFEDFLTNCGTEIVLNAALVAGDPYRWEIQDKFGNIYAGEANADPYGTSLTIDLTDPAEVPTGLINAYGGTYTLKLFSTVDECRQVIFKMARYYTEVRFTTTRGTLVKDSLGCEI